MSERDPTEPVILEYSPADRDRPRTGAASYWGVYAACALVGLLVLEPLVAITLFGHGGDEGVQCFNLASTGFVTIVAVTLRRTWLRHCRPAVALFAAAAMGLGVFVPAYVVLFLFF